MSWRVKKRRIFREQRIMSRAKTPGSPRFDQVLVSVLFACFAPWRENEYWLRPKAALSLRGDYSCGTNPIWRDARYGLPPGAGAGRLYKRTQFRPVAPGLAVQTNPICPRRTSRRGHRWSQSCDNASLPGVVPATNQISPVGGCTNKPNLECSAAMRDALVNKQSQTWAGWDIWGMVPQGGSYRAKQSQFAPTPHGPGIGGRARWADCTNKPNSRQSQVALPRPRQADCAKQSQTWAPWGIRGTGRGTQGKCAKQTQFPGEAGWDRASGTRAFCAEQSQSTRAPGNGRGRDRQVPPGSHCAKQSQLREAGHRGGVSAAPGDHPSSPRPLRPRPSSG
jgi:hypothetical protein